MKRALCGVVVLALAAVSAGCSDKYESAMKEHLGYMREMNEILSGVKDKETLAEAEAAMDKLGEKMKAVSERMEKLGQPSEARMKELTEKYSEQFSEEGAKLAANMMRLVGVAGGKDVSKILEGIKTPE